MKTLTLIRHAKSSWSDPDIADIERPLNGRGKRDAPEMGKRLAERRIFPDLVLTSPARRARRTAKTIIRELPKHPPLAVEPSLYMAEAEEILDLVRNLGSSVAHVGIVGHNPGLTELANILGASHIDNVPTAGVVQFELDVADWRDAAPERARLTVFDYPKRVDRRDSLESAVDSSSSPSPSDD